MSICQGRGWRVRPVVGHEFTSWLFNGGGEFARWRGMNSLPVGVESSPGEGA